MKRAVLLAAMAMVVSCSGGTGQHGGTDGSAPCTTDADCPGTHSCRGGVCVSTGGQCGAAGCAEHTFCDGDGVCKGSVQKPCTSDGECGGDFVCPPTVGLCMEPCNVDSECDLGFVCNNAVSGCAECAFDTQCLDPTKPVCLSEQGRCVACNGPAQCDPGSYCDLDDADPLVRNTCQSGCLAATDCPAGNRCEQVSSAPGVCVACTVPTQADDCVTPGFPYCHPQTRQCVECVEGGQCPAGSVCNPEGTCVECLSDTNCRQGNVCDTSVERCVSGCRNDDGCPPPDDTAATLCEPTAGPFGACVECRTVADCGLGYKCESNRCVEGCDSSTNCPTDRPVCNLIEDRCVECTRDADCPQYLTCDRTADSPTRFECICKELGELCSDTDECGNPPSGGLCVTVSRCVTRVECPGSGWRATTMRCGQQCGIPDNQADCPSGYICRRVEYEGGASANLQCVQNSTCL